MDDLFDAFTRTYDSRKATEMSLTQYLTGCRSDPMMYAGAPERILAAIGEPEMVDTAKDARFGRIFMNRTIRTYPAFADFYGMEETVERIVSFFRHAAQGLEERKQILYLLGPVGGGKSSLAERLKALMERYPIYALKAGDEISPVFESPLGLFDPEQMGPQLEERYGIPRRRLTGLMSPWAIKRLDEFHGDPSKFTVVKLNPSRLRQIAVSKTEPGDENNQDISSLVGKVDIRRLETLSQNDPDAYSYSGGLNRANQGMLEFVEMFKAPIKMLHPLLTATQEGNYVGTENIGAIPFTGIILAHSNESEWQAFRTNKNNEAFIDRIYVIKVPYCLRATEEEAIYEKLIQLLRTLRRPLRAGHAGNAGALLRAVPPARRTRIRTCSRRCGSTTARACARSIRAPAPCRSTRIPAGVDEGMDGVSTRFAFKVLAATFNHDTLEVVADPVHLMYVLEQAIKREQLGRRRRKALPRIHQGRARAALRRIHRPRDPEGLSRILSGLRTEHVRPLRRLCRCLDRGSGFQGSRHRAAAQPRAPQPGADEDREAGGHRQPQGFPQRGRQVLAAVAGRRTPASNPAWTSYEKVREVIERRMFSQVEDLLPVISFTSKRDSETEKKHTEFVERMMSRGYTERQVRRLVEWYMRAKKAG